MKNKMIMNKFLFAALIFLIGNVFLSAQKPVLDNDVYDGWKSI